jgi:hypothetical protein
MSGRPLFLLFALFLVGACGSDSVESPGDDNPPVPPDGLKFYEDIAPILNKHCVTCHREGGAGPFPLITYEDVATVVELISPMVSTRTMPPFNADNSGECNTYKDARWMTDDEISKVVEWADGARLVGDPATAPAVPALPPALARVDATAAMTESYLPAFPRPDDYRCFIMDPGIATDTFLTGFEVRPGSPEVVHHILLFQLDTANAETTVANLDAQSAGPGYECFGGVGAGASLLAVWAPGVRAATYPAGTGLPVKGGRKMVIQIHYHQHPMEFADQTAIDLMLDPAVPEPAFLYLLAAPDLYVPPQQEAFVVTNQYQLPNFFGTFNVWGVFPHMHTLGTSLRAEFDHLGQPTCLTDVPRWDFNWQQGYFYDGPPKIVGGGDMLRISCTYNTMSKGTPTMWGEGTEDEMCLAFAYVSQY